MHGWVDPAYGVQVFREYIFGRRQKVNIGTCTNWGQIIPLASVYKTYNYGCRCEKTHGLWFRTYTKSRHQNFFNIFTFLWELNRLGAILKMRAADNLFFIVSFIGKPLVSSGDTKQKRGISGSN
mgnify:FL=1